MSAQHKYIEEQEPAVEQFIVFEEDGLDFFEDGYMQELELQGQLVRKERLASN